MNDKNARIELRVTQSEKNKIAKLAENCGLSQSEAVREYAYQQRLQSKQQQRNRKRLDHER